MRNGENAAARCTVVLFLLILFGFSIAFLILPDRSFSATENRSLQGLPRLTSADWYSGRYADRMNDYFADQMPAREWLVECKAACELALGKGENDGILRGRNGQLARVRFDARCADGSQLRDVDCFDAAQVMDACRALCEVERRLEIPFGIVLTGRTVDVCASSLEYPREVSDALLSAVDRGLAGTAWVDTVSLLRARHDAGEYVYYKTDHHWTTRGAYYAYVALMQSFGMADAVIDEAAFCKQTVSDRFYGTAAAAGGMRVQSPDTIEIWTLGNEQDFAVTADGCALDGLYSLRYLEGNDQYALFLDGTHDVVTVTRTDGEARPRLLLLKDSFANAMAPFLAQHFDLVLLNLSSTRSDFTDLSHAVEDYDVDFAALIYTLENMITADRLTRLR